jgi:hypothetical protein
MFPDRQQRRPLKIRTIPFISVLASEVHDTFSPVREGEEGEIERGEEGEIERERRRGRDRERGEEDGEIEREEKRER